MAFACLTLPFPIYPPEPGLEIPKPPIKSHLCLLGPTPAMNPPDQSGVDIMFKVT